MLLLADKSEYRALLTEVFTLSGLELDAAPSGRHGNDPLRADRIDFVLTDGSRPERDGFEIMRDLRVSHAGIPVIAISGDVPQNRELFREIAAKFGASWCWRDRFGSTHSW